MVLLKVLVDHDTPVKRRVYQLLFNSKELSKLDLTTPNSDYILTLMHKAYDHYLMKLTINKDDINLVFNVIGTFYITLQINLVTQLNKKNQ